VRHPQLTNINHTILKLRHSMPNVGAWRKLWECFNKMLAWGCCLPSSSAGKLAHALSTLTKVTCQGSSLLVSFVEKASLCSHTVKPSHILQAYSMKKCSIAQSLVPLQLALLLPMEGSNCHWARVPPMSSYVWNRDTLHSPTTRERTPAHQLCILRAQATQTQTKKEYQPPASMRNSEHEWEHLPFLPCDPTIVMDLRISCATVSLQSSSGLSGATWPG